MTTATSHRTLLKKLVANGVEHVDSREWKGDWTERWVVFADLVAFGARAKRSNDVALNNIVRFARATRLAEQAVPLARTFRFSDSTFAVAERFEHALAFAVAIHHACHAINAASVLTKDAPLFHYTIMPRVTLAQGAVLMCPTEPPAPSARYDGLAHGNILAGAGVSAAYDLERSSAGGLLTMATDHVPELKALTVRGGNRSTAAAFERWRSTIETPAIDQLFARDKVVDIPWLLLRPFQTHPGELWCCDRAEFKVAARNFLDLWELSVKEFYFEPARLPLETSKHAAAALRHATQCVQAVAGYKCAGQYYDLPHVRTTLLNAFSAG